MLSDGNGFCSTLTNKGKASIITLANLLRLQNWEERAVYAVVETSGKQYKVRAGEIVEVDKLPLEVGEKIELDTGTFL